jgi:hypothetical protein
MHQSPIAAICARGANLVQLLQRSESFSKEQSDERKRTPGSRGSIRIGRMRRVGGSAAGELRTDDRADLLCGG